MRCPHCHQNITSERLGVPMPLLKARIFDRIKSAGDLGISSAEIIFDLYHERPAVQQTTIKAHGTKLTICSSLPIRAFKVTGAAGSYVAPGHTTGHERVPRTRQPPDPRAGKGPPARRREARLAQGGTEGARRTRLHVPIVGALALRAARRGARRPARRGARRADRL